MSDIQKIRAKIAELERQAERQGVRKESGYFAPHYGRPGQVGGSTARDEGTQASDGEVRAKERLSQMGDHLADRTSPDSGRSYEDAIDAFNHFSDQWLRGVDPDGKIAAYEMAMYNPKLRRGLLEQQFGTWEGTTRVYRVGPVMGGITSVFAKRGAAEGYQRRMGVSAISELLVQIDDLVPSMSGAGECYVDSEHLVKIE